MANKTITQLDAAQSLNDNMVIAVQDTNTTYKTTLADVKAYCGSSADKYKVGDRVNDDSDNPVGTVSSIFTDGNGDRYAVVCLDAVNRLASGAWWSSSYAPSSGLNFYENLSRFSATETATENTTAILNIVEGWQTSSPACEHCRSKYYTIDGVTYYGQFPNFKEVIDILSIGPKINANDPTATQYSSLVIPTTSKYVWTSTYGKSGDTSAWTVYTSGSGAGPASQNLFVIPVLEIPLEE